MRDPSGPLKQLYLFDSTEFKVQNQEREGFFFFFLNYGPRFWNDTQIGYL